MIALLDTNDDVISTGADNYTVESFNAAYPDYEYPAVTKIDDAPTHLQYKQTTAISLAMPEIPIYHTRTGGTGTEADDYMEVKDLRPLKLYRRAQINAKTSELIARGLTFPVDAVATTFALSAEDQRNYTGLIIAKDLLAYAGDDRVTIKGKDPITLTDVYFQPDSSAEVVAFYAAGLAYVKAVLEAGWDLKDAIEVADEATLMDWEELRA